MSHPLGFAIGTAMPLGAQIAALGFSRFDRLAEHVKAVPYGRTADSADPLAVLRENRGTCSSKHRLLAMVAHASDHIEVRLTVGIYLMSEANTPGVGGVLRAAALSSIPEAHCYLTVADGRFDFTGLAAGPASPFDSLLDEYFVAPADLQREKPRAHKQALASWAPQAGLSPEAAWSVREACIAALAAA